MSLRMYFLLLIKSFTVRRYDDSAGALEHEIRELLIEALALEEISPSEIEAAEPLFVEGLGLDSIDALEISLAIAQNYDVQLKADDENNKAIFSSLRSLSNHIASQR